MKNENSKFGFRLLLFIWLLTQKCAARDIFNLTFAYCDIKCFLMSVCLLSHHFKETWQVSASTQQQSQVKFSTRICPFGHTQYDIIFWSFRWQFVLHIFSIGKVKRPWKKFPPQSSQDFFAALLSSKSDQWVVEDQDGCSMIYVEDGFKKLFSF